MIRVDDAEAMYRRALAFAATRELTEFGRRSRTCGISSGSWRRTERLDIKNVL